MLKAKRPIFLFFFPFFHARIMMIVALLFVFGVIRKKDKTKTGFDRVRNM